MRANYAKVFSKNQLSHWLTATYNWRRKGDSFGPRPLKTRKLLIFKFAELAKPHKNGSFVNFDAQTRYSDRVPVHRGQCDDRSRSCAAVRLQKQHRHISSADPARRRHV